MSGHAVFERCDGDKLFLCSWCILNSPRSCPEQQGWANSEQDDVARKRGE